MTPFNLTIKVQSYDFSRIAEIACPEWAQPEDIIRVFQNSEELELPAKNPIGGTIQYIVANEQDEILKTNEDLKRHRGATLTVAPKEFFVGYIASIRA